MTKLISLTLLIFCTSFISKTEFTQQGKASFYANKFEGRRTSSGEVFKQNNLTGAHKSLPFGTLVKVTNLKNDSTVILKINDRLGKSSASIVDVSLKAAKQLNFVRNGYAQVKLEVLEK